MDDLKKSKFGEVWHGPISYAFPSVTAEGNRQKKRIFVTLQRNGVQTQIFIRPVINGGCLNGQITEA